MKSKKRITKQNTTTINEFLSMYGPDTQKEFSEFLFDLQGHYLANQSGCWRKKGARDVACRFALLYRLVNGIHEVK